MDVAKLILVSQIEIHVGPNTKKIIIAKPINHYQVIAPVKKKGS